MTSKTVTNVRSAMKVMGLAVVLMGAGAGVAIAQEGTQPGAQAPAQPGGERVVRREGETKTATATVQAIDRDKRTVTLKNEDGKTMTVDVPQDVQAFDQIKKGDKVRTTYTESLALSVYRPGEAKPDAQTTESMQRSQGAQPGRMMERQQTISAEVVSVDAKKNMVKVKGPDGKTKEVTVQDPQVRERLKTLKPGEVIELTYTEAMAISLEPASKK